MLFLGSYRQPTTHNRSQEHTPHRKRSPPLKRGLRSKAEEREENRDEERGRDAVVLVSRSDTDRRRRLAIIHNSPLSFCPSVIGSHTDKEVRFQVQRIKQEDSLEGPFATKSVSSSDAYVHNWSCETPVGRVLPCLSKIYKE